MNEEGIEHNESQLALKAIQDAERTVIVKTRGPIWRTALATLLLAVVLLSNWKSEQAPLAEPVTWFALAALFTLAFFYYAGLHQKGIRMRLIPSSTAGKSLFIGQVIVYLALIKGADWLLEHGHHWGTWVATALICIGFALTLHFCPTGEPVTRLRNR
jgi:O-antigen/teichoic acid export membrane protein